MIEGGKNCYCLLLFYLPHNVVSNNLLQINRLSGFPNCGVFQKKSVVCFFYLFLPGGVVEGGILPHPQKQEDVVYQAPAFHLKHHSIGHDRADASEGSGEIPCSVKKASV